MSFQPLNALKAPSGPAVLLFRGEGLLSWVIRMQTRGQYSHAALLTDDGRVIESWPGEGVRVRMISDWRGIDAFSVDRMSPMRWQWAIDYVMREVGCKYDWRNVCRFISRREAAHNERWFCSELVFAALADVGVTLLRGIAPCAVSPQMLSLSPLLLPIKTERPASDPHEDDPNITSPIRA